MKNGARPASGSSQFLPGSSRIRGFEREEHGSHHGLLHQFLQRSSSSHGGRRVFSLPHWTLQADGRESNVSDDHSSHRHRHERDPRHHASQGPSFLFFSREFRCISTRTIWTSLEGLSECRRLPRVASQIAVFATSPFSILCRIFVKRFLLKVTQLFRLSFSTTN